VSILNVPKYEKLSANMFFGYILNGCLEVTTISLIFRKSLNQILENDCIGSDHWYAEIR